MISPSRTALLTAITCFGTMLQPQAEAFTVESLPMYSVFYPGVSNQPCIRIKVTAAAGEKIKYVVNNKLGGVIIWAYEGDAKLKAPRSLSKAIDSDIKQSKR